MIYHEPCASRITKEWKLKKASLIYNVGHNKLELFNVLEMFLLITSKAVLDIFHKKHRTQAAHELANGLRLGILGN